MNSEDILNKICYCTNNEIFLDYPHFKKLTYTLNQPIFDIVIAHFIKVLTESLKNHSLFIIHLNVKSISITDVDKYYNFIKNYAILMKTMFPDKLDKCIIYNSPILFKNIFGLISIFLDKATQQKFLF